MSDTKRILVWHGKHATVYFDASTTKAWAEACLAVAKELDEFEAYQEFEIEEDPEIDIDSLPEVYQAGARHTAKQIARSNAEAIDNNKDVATIKAAIAANSVSIVRYNGGTERERVEPALWAVLSKRARYQYEDVRLENVLDPGDTGEE